MALTNAFGAVRGKAIAGGLAAMMTLAALGGAAQAQDLAANTTGIKATPISTGTDATAPGTQARAPIIIEYGRKFDENVANAAAGALLKKGCFAQVANGGPYKGMKASYGTESIVTRDPGDVYNFGIRHCDAS